MSMYIEDDLLKKSYVDEYIDKLFKETGFEPVDVKPFDPDDIVILKENGQHYHPSEVHKILHSKTNTELSEVVTAKKSAAEHTQRELQMINEDRKRHEKNKRVRERFEKDCAERERMVQEHAEQIKKEQEATTQYEDIRVTDMINNALWKDRDFPQKITIEQKDIFSVYTNTDPDIVFAVCVKKISKKITKIMILMDGKRYDCTDFVGDYISGTSSASQSRYQPPQVHEYAQVYRAFEDALILKGVSEDIRMETAEYLNKTKQDICDTYGLMENVVIRNVHNAHTFDSCANCKYCVRTDITKCLHMQFYYSIDHCEFLPTYCRYSLDYKSRVFDDDTEI